MSTSLSVAVHSLALSGSNQPSTLRPKWIPTHLPISVQASQPWMFPTGQLLPQAPFFPSLAPLNESTLRNNASVAATRQSRLCTSAFSIDSPSDPLSTIPQIPQTPPFLSRLPFFHHGTSLPRRLRRKLNDWNHGICGWNHPRQFLHLTSLDLVQSLAPWLAAESKKIMCRLISCSALISSTRPFLFHSPCLPPTNQPTNPLPPLPDKRDSSPLMSLRNWQLALCTSR
jgi:hypothetical protein